MQLSLSFEYEELKKTPLTKEDFSQISEFEQGNFTSVICSRFTADEIAKILLQSESTLPELKISLLKQRGVCAARLDTEINESYKEHIKSHNDSVRAALRVSYAGKAKKRLKKNGFDKFRKYNNAYWDFYGGKSSSKLSVTDENHEWHDKYLKEEESYLQESLSLLCGADLSDRDEIHTYYMQVFGEDEYRDARDEYFRSSIVNAIKSENLESLRNLYTKSFGETYCADSLEGMEISESQKAYLISLWQISPPTSVDTKDKELSIEKQPERKFKDSTTSWLYTNIDKLDEVHTPYLMRLKKGYREIIISMNLSEEELSIIFNWFIQSLINQEVRENAVDLFTYCTDALGREKMNALFYKKIKASETPLPSTEMDIIHRLAHAYSHR